MDNSSDIPQKKPKVPVAANFMVIVANLNLVAGIIIWFTKVFVGKSPYGAFVDEASDIDLLIGWGCLIQAVLFLAFCLVFSGIYKELHFIRWTLYGGKPETQPEFVGADEEKDASS